MSTQQAVSETSAGKLHLLDLAEMKSRMGDRWTRMSETIERFFEGAMRRHMGPGDTFIRQDELSYIVLLRDLSPEGVQLKCRTICEEVCERLFGGDQLYRASLRALTSAVGPEILSGDAMPAALNDLLEAKGAEMIFQAATASGQNDPNQTKSPAPEAEPDDDLTFSYRPIWDATKNVVVTYLCQTNEPNYAPLIGAGRDDAPPQDRQAAIDKRVLQECAARNLRLHQSGLRILSGVSVALDTLSHSRLWSSYSRDLQTIAPLISRDFAFFVTGIDSGVPNIRLAQELPKLTRLSPQIFCVIDDRGYIGSRFARTGAHAIGIQLSPGETEASAMGRIVELARQAAEGALAAFVLGVPSTCIMLHALGQGIRYLEGSIIRPAVSDPCHAFSQSLEYVYTSKNSKLPLDKRGAVKS